MALVGVYLHRCGCVSTDGKRTLALISQQVTFPLFLFTKIIYCNQNWSDKPCPDVSQSLADVWLLVLWPIYVVGVGRFWRRKKLHVHCLVWIDSDLPLPHYISPCTLYQASLLAG
jgi:predicted permease